MKRPITPYKRNASWAADMQHFALWCFEAEGHWITSKPSREKKGHWVYARTL